MLTLHGLRAFADSDDVEVLKKTLRDAIANVEKEQEISKELLNLINKRMFPKSTFWSIKDRIMMLKANSPAIHMLGNISRECDDIIWIEKESEEMYEGQFKYGFGFIGVKFFKEDVRPLTKEEIDELNTKYNAINNTVYGKNNFDYEGYPVGKGE